MSKNFSENNLLKIALERLRSGDVVAIPTETVYGLGADISNPTAIDKIFSTKERPFFDPLIVHLHDQSQALHVVAEFPQLAKTLAEHFWPGPLTLVLPKHKDLNPKITSGLETVGIRVPRNELTRELIRQLGHPIAAPSANKFGRTSPTSAVHVQEEFGEKVTVLDDGPCEVGVESTVIGFSPDFLEIYIYRPGAVTQEMLAKFAETQVMSSPAAPGQLAQHYVPKKPLIVLSSVDNLSPQHYLQIANEIKVKALYPAWMNLPKDPLFAARLLYANMRTAAETSNTNCIILPYNLTKNSPGIHVAIVDRLEKAARLII